ncbi:MAG: hypothetical protein K2L17_08555 [Muribaculaceae bacterium]|nr:hypothetical protein [Muribaculaceae bacterium]MDE6786544.1 hypothetical protein [Muribaculaceae bacterium]
MDTTQLNLLWRCFPNATDPTDFSFEAVGTFSLTDDKSCYQDRNSNRCPSDCSREIIIIHSNSPLTIVAFDEWLKDFPISTCDYLLYNSDTQKKIFALCELTCSLPHYVEDRVDNVGKRAKAYSQMISSWKLIAESENPVFKAQILNYVRKIGIFGWRDRKSDIQDGAMKSLRSFVNTPGSQAGIKTFHNYVFGENFEFIQVKYPHTLHL